jgi:hypothetical protein
LISGHLHSSLLSLCLLKLKLFRVQTTLQLVILQHRINATALFLHLLLLTAAADASAGTPRLTGLALPIIGSVLNTGASGC